ncbi:CRISPR-associated endoribonuclease Cas6 [Lebetimonas sp. JH292]|uniref:CRISPR-associated endoribonuclease Cas6 n=1 Tax=Lebetimonas sp. JH292 TaxID=990068 RepID=UPI00046502DC|nr:CRISPR-associated endoribonuclease Cas6 [Lebetimonas sp. JH292]
MKFFELKINVDLKIPIHFQKSPEAVSKLIATSLISSGFERHKNNEPKNYVFSNLGKADAKGFFEKGNIYFRSFDENLAKKVLNSLFLYEDNIFKVKGVDFKKIKYKKINYMLSLNPVFVVMKNGDFWTFQKNGDLINLMSALQDNLIRKYEMFFNEKLKPENNFMELIQIKNNKPQTYYYKGIKFFGWKFYIAPRNDEVSQKLAFTALGTGLGHKQCSRRRFYEMGIKVYDKLLKLFCKGVL